jgi:Protein of unknown function (DUF3592)
MQTHFKRAFIFLAAATAVSAGTAFFFENNYVANSIKIMGKIISFQPKSLQVGTGDPQEMQIEFSAPDGAKLLFHSGRNVIEHITGKYAIGDKIPVLFNPKAKPIAKIAYTQHLYINSIMFLIGGFILLCGLFYAWRLNMQRNEN